MEPVDERDLLLRGPWSATAAWSRSSVLRIAQVCPAMRRPARHRRRAAAARAVDRRGAGRWRMGLGATHDSRGVCAARARRRRDRYPMRSPSFDRSASQGQGRVPHDGRGSATKKPMTSASLSPPPGSRTRPFGPAGLPYRPSEQKYKGQAYRLSWRAFGSRPRRPPCGGTSDRPLWGPTFGVTVGRDRFLSAALGPDVPGPFRRSGCRLPPGGARRSFRQRATSPGMAPPHFGDRPYALGRPGPACHPVLGGTSAAISFPVRRFGAAAFENGAASPDPSGGSSLTRSLIQERLVLGGNAASERFDAGSRPRGSCQAVAVGSIAFPRVDLSPY